MTLLSPNRKKVAVVGGGAAGVAVAARLFRMLKQPDVTLFETSMNLEYRDLWPLVGAGLAKPQEAVRLLRDYLPEGIRWVRSEIKKLDVLERVIETEDKAKYNFEYIVLAPEAEFDFSGIKGAEEALGGDGVASIFGQEHLAIAQKELEIFAGGTAIFTHQMAGAMGAHAHRVMFLFDEMLRKKGLREKTKILFCTTEGSVFEIPALQGTIGEILQRKGIEIKHRHSLKKIDPANQIAHFEILNEEGKKESTVELSYDLLHIMPEITPPKHITKAKTAAKKPLKGWIEIDPTTLQHPKYKHVFAAGDMLAEPEAKPGLHLRKQIPVVTDNLVKAMRGIGPALFSRYKNHHYLPVEIAPQRALLAEFEDSQPRRSFLLDLSKEGFLPWIVERHLLPRLHWHLLLRGIS